MSDTIFEDVENIIQTITPYKTPFIAAIGKGKATSTLHDWLEDSLTAPTGTNKAIEGADAVATSRTPPERLSNYCQIIEDTFMVSGTMEAVRAIGRGSESAYQLGKSFKYLATELEYACLNNTTSSAGAAATARQTKGLAGFISTNEKGFESATAENNFSESILMLMAQGCYEEGGDPSTLLVSPSQSRKMAAWDQSNRVVVNTNASEKALIMAVMVLETPFGRMKVTIDRYIAETTTGYDTAFLFDPSMCSVAYLRPTKTTELAKVGDSRKFQSVMEAAFVCHNEKAHATAVNLYKS